MEKIILYYKFMPVKDPEAIRLWQRTLCEKLNLRGRVIISPHGINGTLGGNLVNLKTYVKETRAYFKNTRFKWSEGGREHFPKLSVKVRPEIVTFGVANELKVNESGVVDGGKHLKPTEVNQLVNRYGNKVIFFDGRNSYESDIGRFKNAIVPNTTSTRDFVKELESGRYNDIKSKKVVTYCTGGIRCEVLTRLMIKRGFKDVYQIDGGIVKYGEKYGDNGLWEGKCYVFDGRISIQFSDKARDVGACIVCSQPTSRYINCALKSCNKLVLVCLDCYDRECIKHCSRACYDQDNRVASASSV